MDARHGTTRHGLLEAGFFPVATRFKEAAKVRTDLAIGTYDYGAGQYQLNPNRFFHDVMEKLFLGVQYVHGFDVIGDIAEFGTMTGKTAGLLAHALGICDAQFEKNLRLAGLPRKRLYLFDSFQGLPSSESSPVDQQSPHIVSKIWRQGACRGMSARELAEFVGNIIPRDRVAVVEGWFADTLPTIPKGVTYSLIHIDCDLYSSSIDVLSHLFSNRMVAEGALILFDDWNCNRASDNYGERRAWRECVDRHAIRYSDEGAYGFTSHKFIVHDYR